MVAFVLIIIFGIEYYLLFFYHSGTYNTFSRCLTEKGVVMYGTETCFHCKNQRAKFGDSFKYINYTDCDKNRELCIEKNILAFPTWVFANDGVLQGEQPFEILGNISGCQSISDEELNKIIT